MDKNQEKRQTLREVLVFALGQLVCLGLMYGIYAMLGRLDRKVLQGGGIGVLVAVGNYFLMAVGVFAAANKAEAGDVAGGKRIMSLSMLGRYLLMIGILAACAKSGLCDVIAMLIPLLLTRILIFVGEFFRRKDG